MRQCGQPAVEFVVTLTGLVYAGAKKGNPYKLRFMGTDTGDDFAMLNAIDFHETPRPGPGVDPDDTTAEVMAKYTRPFMAQAFRNAAHPVFLGTAAANALDLWGVEGAYDWSFGGLVRYRSRRDLMEQAVFISKLPGHNIHDFKIAAIEKTIAFPVDPRVPARRSAARARPRLPHRRPLGAARLRQQERSPTRVIETRPRHRDRLTFI